MFKIIILFFSMIISLDDSFSSREVDSKYCSKIKKHLKEGDIIFIDIKYYAFQKVARLTGGWTNHVGFVLYDEGEQDWVVRESKVPFVIESSFCNFIARSKNERVAIKRLKNELTRDDIQKIRESSTEKFWSIYNFSFNLEGYGTYCSKFIYEVYKESLGIEVGKVETGKDLFDRFKKTPYFSEDIWFWKLWFLGHLPLDSKVVTPQSQIDDEKFHFVLEIQRDDES